MNLILNTRDALPEGGEITISVSRSPEYSLLIVEDNGYGMDTGTKEKIFNPFFLNPPLDFCSI